MLDRKIWLEIFLNKIFDYKKVKYNDMLLQFSDKNCSLTGNYSSCFTYCDKIYLKKYQNFAVSKLDERLEEPFEEFLLELNQYKNERKTVRQVICNLLLECETVTEVLNSFPSILLKQIDSIGDIEVLGKYNVLLKNNKLKKQVDTILPIIEKNIMFTYLK